jgi:hypothetical protein
MVGSNYGPCFLQNQCGRVKPAVIDSELLGCLRRQSNFKGKLTAPQLQTMKAPPTIKEGILRKHLGQLSLVMHLRGL